jgi:hypothetical protein
LLKGGVIESWSVGGAVMTETRMRPPAKLAQTLLVVTGLGLVPAALSYGLAPGASLPWLFGIDASSVNTRHIFRAMAGLYLAMVGFFLAGALFARMRIPALWGLIVFMGGLGMGRLVSLIVDGWPNLLLFAYLIVEFALAAIAVWLLLAMPPPSEQ